MLDNVLTLFESTGAITVMGLLVCTLASIVLGIAAALLYTFQNAASKGFVLTLALLPAVVQLVIILVNGNLGAGVAVAGAFSLVRFRSAPGSAREILGVFLAMAIGLATGMGYVGIAAIFLAVVGGAQLLLIALSFGEGNALERALRVVIPENLDYTHVFDDLFERYCASAELERVKTTNLGSMYELCYHIRLRRAEEEKAFLDAIRCRNGNLTIICGHLAAQKEAL